MRVVRTIGVLMGVWALAACQSSGALEYPDEISGVISEPLASRFDELPPRIDESLPPAPRVARDEAEPVAPYEGVASAPALDASAMDEEETELRQAFSGADLSVLREGDSLVLQIDGHMLFQSDEAELTPRGRDVVQSLAALFNRYPSTYVNIDGFTAGARMLSQERADAFALELERAGVQANRLSALGHDDSPAAKLEITLEPVAG